MSERKTRTGNGITAAFLAAESSLKQYLMRYFVREQDIEDVVQETYLRAFESERSQVIRSPRAFLFTVAKNIALSEVSRKANQLMITMGDLGALDVIDGKPSPDDELEISVRMAALGDVVNGLPPQCRRVLVMRMIFGFSHREIAQRLNISVRTVEKHLTKALQRCQESRRDSDSEISAASNVTVRKGRPTGT